MSFRTHVACASLLTAVAIGMAPPVQAQDTTRTRDSTRARASQQRILVRKQSSGEVSLRPLTAKERADSIARADSMRRADSVATANKMREDAEKARADSVAAAEKARADSIAAIEKARANSVAAVEKARTDSIAAAERIRSDSIAQANAMKAQQPVDRYRFGSSGFYVGLAGGGGIPTGDFKNLGYDAGWGVNVPLGWHKPGSALGVQFDLGYNQFNGTSFSGGGATPSVLTNSDPKVWNANVNLTLNWPLTESKRTSLYVIGGGGVYRFQNFGTTSALGAFLGNDVLTPDSPDNQSSRTKWGVNGGAGLEFGIGPTSLFVESRLVNVFGQRADNASFSDFFGERTKDVRWIPITLGLKFR